jgi:O-antigen/teichoic acid export membrane protein
MAASAAAACLVNHVALKHEARKAGVRLAYRGVRRELSILWRFSLPAFLSGAIVGPVMWAASAMLVRQPGGYAEMGVFDAAQRWGRMLLMVPALLSTVVVPVLSERLGANDRGEARKTLMIGTLANAALVVPVALVLTIASPWAMSLFGADFVPGWPVLILVLAAVVLAALQTPAAQLLVATGRMWTGAAMNLGWALALLGACSVLLARGWGALGIAVAYLLSYAVHSVWVFLFLYRLLGRQVPDAGLKTHAGVEAKGTDDRVERKPYTGTAVARS